MQKRIELGCEIPFTRIPPIVEAGLRAQDRQFEKRDERIQEHYCMVRHCLGTCFGDPLFDLMLMYTLILASCSVMLTVVDERFDVGKRKDGKMFAANLVMRMLWYLKPDDFPWSSAGDLRARLDLITLESAEAALGQRRCKHLSERSMLSYLQDPGDGVGKHQAASAILEQLADETEEAAFDSVPVFRYVEIRELRKDHPSSDVRSAEDLVKQLSNSEFVQANIFFGTFPQSTKRN